MLPSSAHGGVIGPVPQPLLAKNLQPCSPRLYSTPDRVTELR